MQPALEWKPLEEVIGLGWDEEKEKYHVLEQTGQRSLSDLFTHVSQALQEYLVHSKHTIAICRMSNLICQDGVTYLTHWKSRKNAHDSKNSLLKSKLVLALMAGETQRVN